uniref:SPASM domain-containing protein n=1 Tax=Thermodesulfobacterium geofontis TaxID=1295609 RepID=A0A7V4JQH1_9BACT
MVQKKRETTACKVELMKNFDIVNGKVVPCIDLPINFYIAEVDEKENLNFKNKKFIKAFLNDLVKYKRILNCFNCEAYYYCGGRCPVQAISSLERTRNYCELTKLFIREVESHLKKIEPIIKPICSLENFYQKFVFPIYFTDVVP